MSWGQLFIANPDLPKRFALHAAAEYAQPGDVLRGGRGRVYRLPGTGQESDLGLEASIHEQRMVCHRLSTGFGRSLVTRALAAGERVVATARSPAQLDDLAAQYPDTIRTLALDVTDEQQVKSVVAQAGDSVRVVWTSS